MQKTYSTLTEICRRYSVSQNYLKKFDLVEGVHYITIGSMKRYDNQEMHKLLVAKAPQTNYNPILEKFLV